MSAVRIVHNALLGGWFIVRGSHDTPISGKFDSKAEAKAHLDAKAAPKRRVKLNQWGNWKGYEGSRGVHDFGTNEQAAQDWAAGGPLPRFDATQFKSKIGGGALGVEVNWWASSEVPHGIDAAVGVGHAKLGYPVDIMVRRSSTNAHRLHLSLAEVRQLHAQLTPLLKLRD